MHRLSFLFAVIFLAQTGLAAACHGVGDVHIICHADSVETVYVETDTQAQKHIADNECCTAFHLTAPVPASQPVACETVVRPVWSLMASPAGTATTTHPPSRGPPASAVF